MWCSSYDACFIRIITNVIATEDISFLRYMFLFISRVVLNCTRNVPLLIYIDREFISVGIFSLSSRANHWSESPKIPMKRYKSPLSSGIDS